MSTNLQTFYRNIIKNSPIFLNHQFVIRFFGNDVPDNLRSDAKNPAVGITYYVKSSEVPAIKIKENEINFLSQKFAVPGGVQHDGSWNVTMMITNDLLPYKNLYAWQQTFASLKNDGGAQTGYQKAIPDAHARVELLDSSMQNILRTFTLVGVFPDKIPDLSMKYENNSNPITVSFGITYQYMFDNEEKDPLGGVLE